MSDTKREKENYIKYLIPRIFWFITIWTLMVIIIIFLEGFSLCPFQLPDNVLHILIGGTTAKVLGTFIAVLRYLFHSKTV